MSNNLGAIFSSGNDTPRGTPSVTYYVDPSQVVRTVSQPDQVNNIIVQLLASRKGKVIMNHLLNTPFNTLLKAALNQNLSTAQKFKKIFGVELKDVQNSGGLLGVIGDGVGTIFDDIGGWFSRTFSSGNMSKVEDFLRRVQNQTGEFANVLNTFRNKPVYNPETDRTTMDKITNTAFDISEFFSKYGIFLVGGLIVYIIATKK